MLRFSAFPPRLKGHIADQFASIYDMPPSRRAGDSAYVEKFPKASGDPGYVVHCRLCNVDDDGRSWSSRSAARRALGRRRGFEFDSFADAMDLWTLHVRCYHPEAQQPQWNLSNDLDVGFFADAEARYFEESEQEKLMRTIFGR
jgi:hypothetical protein